MRQFSVVMLLATVVAIGHRQGRAEGPEADIDAAQVRKSIERGVAFLKSKQDANGNWPEHLNQVGGVTALCTLALLNCGTPPDDDGIQRCSATCANSARRPPMWYRCKPWRCASPSQRRICSEFSATPIGLSSIKLPRAREAVRGRIRISAPATIPIANLRCLPCTRPSMRERK